MKNEELKAELEKKWNERGVKFPAHLCLWTTEKSPRYFQRYSYYGSYGRIIYKTKTENINKTNNKIICKQGSKVILKPCRRFKRIKNT